MQQNSPKHKVNFFSGTARDVYHTCASLRTDVTIVCYRENQKTGSRI